MRLAVPLAAALLLAACGSPDQDKLPDDLSSAEGVERPDPALEPEPEPAAKAPSEEAPGPEPKPAPSEDGEVDRVLLAQEFSRLLQETSVDDEES